MGDLKHIKRRSAADATASQLVCLPGWIASKYNYFVIKNVFLNTHISNDHQKKEKEFDLIWQMLSTESTTRGVQISDVLVCNGGKG